MKRRKNPKSVGIGLGTSSIMMIFTVLCLTVFATLTFLQGAAALKKSEQYEESLSAYYLADSLAVQKQAAALEILLDSPLEEQHAALAALEIEQDQEQLSYSVSIQAQASLEVVLIFDGQRLQVQQWQQVVMPEDEYGSPAFID